MSGKGGTWGTAETVKSVVAKKQKVAKPLFGSFHCISGSVEWSKAPNGWNAVAKGF
jgi:hypothetical protein